MLSVRHRPAVLNWRVCLTRRPFRPRACSRLLGNSSSAKQLPSCRRRSPVPTLTLSGKIEAPTGAPSPPDLAAVLSVEPAEASQVFFSGVGVPLCFAQLKSNEAVHRAAINRSAWAATLSRAWSPHIFFFAGNLHDGGKLYARMWAPALGVEEDPATFSA